MNYGSNRVYGVNLSYLMANGDRSFSYYEIPADSEYDRQSSMYADNGIVSIYLLLTSQM